MEKGVVTHTKQAVFCVTVHKSKCPEWVRRSQSFARTKNRPSKRSSCWNLCLWSWRVSCNQGQVAVTWWIDGLLIGLYWQLRLGGVERWLSIWLNTCIMFLLWHLWSTWLTFERIDKSRALDKIPHVLPMTQGWSNKHFILLWMWILVWLAFKPAILSTQSWETYF